MWRPVVRWGMGMGRMNGTRRNLALPASWGVLVGLLAVAGWLSACRAAPPVVKIGLVAPFEGRHRALGYDVIYSARLAVQEINQQGGLDGQLVALVAYDDRGDPDLATEIAQALTLDPAVIAVIGHWQPATTAAAAPIYAAAGLPLLPMGEPPFGVFDPADLPVTFQTAYATLTPFEETAGRYAGTAYDACQLILAVMRQAQQTAGGVTRAQVAAHLHKAQIAGITGESLTWPAASP